MNDNGETETRGKGLSLFGDVSSPRLGLAHTMDEGGPDVTGQKQNEDGLDSEGDGRRSRQEHLNLGVNTNLGSASSHAKDGMMRIGRHTGRASRSRKRRRQSISSSESREDSPPSRRSKARKKDSNVNLINKFLTVLEKFKSSDKPKMQFNTNVIPEFDPLVKEQTILTWLTKVEECAEIYGWEEKEIIHYSLPKLAGVAKTWYQGLTSILHSWPEWKKKLIESFPCREDYAVLLTEMLAKKVKYGESLETYYYTKLNLLNRCKIYGRQAVDCLLFGIEDRAVKISAQAAQFKEPEQVLKYFRTVKIGLGTNSNRTDSSKPGTSAVNSTIRCYNCSEIGHPSFKCEKPLVKCTSCDRIGHQSTNCNKNKRTGIEFTENKSTDKMTVN